jgi:nucleoside 2-deoxyribosyltransferase
MITKVYVAGSSKELARAQAVMAKLEEHDIHVMSTWPKVIGKVGAANPADATIEQLTKWTLRDLAEVEESDILALLLPAMDVPTVGAWVELGYAYARNKPIIASGPHRPIFTPVLVSVYCESDDDLVQRIVDRHRVAVKRDIAVVTTRHEDNRKLLREYAGHHQV